MGKETAKRLLRRGGEVWIVARNKARLAQAQAELAPDGPVQTAAVDLYDQSQVDAFIAQVQDEKRHIKYLVNTAGVFKPTPFLHTPGPTMTNTWISTAVCSLLPRRWRRT